MQHPSHDTRPGIGFVDRYMPGASAEEREAAYERLCRFVAVLVRVNDRLALEQRDAGIREDVGGAVESAERREPPAV